MAQSDTHLMERLIHCPADIVTAATPVLKLHCAMLDVYHVRQASMIFRHVLSSNQTCLQNVPIRFAPK